MKINKRNILGLLAVLAILAAPAHGQQVSQCGSLSGPDQYGPYDYTNADHRVNKLPIVESNHFDANVRNLQGGARGKGPEVTKVASDIDYTLRAFPNHHKALDAMARLHIREGTNDLSRRYNSVNYSMECYFERATRFRPRDGNVRLIQGIYFYRLGNYDEAIEHMSAATSLMPKSPEAHYNLGLTYLKTKDYDSARTNAQRAYALGHPLPGLRNKLRRVGEWEEQSG